MKMLWNNVYHARTKYIHDYFHYIKEQLERETIQLEHVSTSQQIFTKPLEKKAFICSAQDPKHLLSSRFSKLSIDFLVTVFLSDKVETYLPCEGKLANEIQP